MSNLLKSLILEIVDQNKLRAEFDAAQKYIGRYWKGNKIIAMGSTNNGPIAVLENGEHLSFRKIKRDIS
jgi:hypothetical protein